MITSLEISLFLGQFWGFLMVITCGLVLVRRKVIFERLWDMAGDRSFTFLSGYIALILGLVTILTHNVWTQDWRLVVTLFGWVALIKGIVRIGFPELLNSGIKKFKKNSVLTSGLLVAGLLLGAWLVSVSWV